MILLLGKLNQTTSTSILHRWTSALPCLVVQIPHLVRSIQFPLPRIPGGGFGTFPQQTQWLPRHPARLLPICGESLWFPTQTQRLLYCCHEIPGQPQQGTALALQLPGWASGHVTKCEHTSVNRFSTRFSWFTDVQQVVLWLYSWCPLT